MMVRSITVASDKSTVPHPIVLFAPAGLKFRSAEKLVVGPRILTPWRGRTSANATG